MLKAGELDQRVTFQRRTRTTDNQGGGTVTWAAIANLSDVPASLRWESGLEALQADQATSSRRGILRVRFSDAADGVTEADRALWGTRVLTLARGFPGGMRLREWIEYQVSERSA